MYLIYVDLPLHECFMTFAMYILDVFIPQIGLWSRVMPWLILILYYIHLVNRIISICRVFTEVK